MFYYCGFSKANVREIFHSSLNVQWHFSFGSVSNTNGNGNAFYQIPSLHGESPSREQELMLSTHSVVKFPFYNLKALLKISEMLFLILV